MPLTFAQNTNKNLMNSLKDFINTNIIIPYNTAASSTNYPSQLGIQVARPPDPMVKPVLPLIVLGWPTNAKTPDTIGMGDNAVYTYVNMRVNFFPALTSDNKPSEGAAFLLRDYAAYALTTPCYIPFNDYANGGVQVEAIQLLDGKIVTPTGQNDTILDIERYRFDVTLLLKVSVLTLNG